MDETGVQEAEESEGTVVGTSRSRRARVSKNSAAGWMSVLHSISALGQKTTNTYILKGSTLQAQWFPEDLEEAELTSTPKGWTNMDIALDWLVTVFYEETRPRESPQQPKPWRMLILDGHKAHTSPRFMLTA